MVQQKRNTKTKQWVMSVLESSSTALYHEEIEKRLPEKVDRVTIYRILQSFCDDGKVHKIINEEGKACYAPCRDCTAGHHHDNHPHFRCTGCGTISCVTSVAVQAPSLPDGYNVSDVSCLITGYCPDCSSDKRKSNDAILE
jgi:Fe2+ or Zn2+ uptake regulation protein